MDRTDRQIINLLHRDGRMTNVAIARRIGVSEGTVRKRIDQLISGGMLRIRGLVRPEDVGYGTRALIMMNVELARMEEVSALLRQMRKVLSVKWLTGQYDLAVEAVFRDDKDLAAFLNDRISRINGITRTETADIVHAAKRSEEWSVPIQTEPKILVVDDDPDFVEVTRLILERSGYTVQSAANGDAALQSMITQPPDLVILDIMMDGILDGWNASWRIRSNPALRETPILVVSSITSSDYLGMFPTDDDHLIDNFLSKPVSPEKLLSEVNRLLERA